MGEDQVGHKGRSDHHRWMSGQCPAGRWDGRIQSAHIFAAVEPQTGLAFGLAAASPLRFLPILSPA
jgi:hypothetical protein